MYFHFTSFVTIFRVRVQPAYLFLQLQPTILVFFIFVYLFIAVTANTLPVKFINRLIYITNLVPTHEYLPEFTELGSL